MPKYYPGFVNYDNPKSETKPNLVEIKYSLSKEGKFSMSGSIWNARRTDIVAGGQCIDTIAELFPEDKKIQQMHQVWRKYHLNDCTAGSPRQEEFLEGLGITSYDEKIAKLKEAGLEPDTQYLHNGKPYSYGSAWLKTEIPVEIIAQIKSWKPNEEPENKFLNTFLSLLSYERYHNSNSFGNLGMAIITLRVSAGLQGTTAEF
jgi:hypothetical protein